MKNTISGRQEKSIMKLVVEAETDKVVGASMCGPDAPEIMQVAWVRNSLAYATHKFFHDNGFDWVPSPIITASDCEGAGEQFCATTLIPCSSEVTESPVSVIPSTKDGSIDWSQVSANFRVLNGVSTDADV